MSFFAKKMFLLGFIVIILTAIPLSVYILQQQRATKTFAVASTRLSFNPEKAQIEVGQTVKFDILLDPTFGKPPNQISFVKLVINYDPQILSTDEAGLVVNSQAFPVTLDEPTYIPRSILTTLSVGADPAKVIQTPTKVAEISFKALAKTTSTQIAFAEGTQVLSVATADEAGENVIAQKSPAIVAVAATTAPPPIPTPTPTLPPGVTPTVIPAPTQKPDPIPSPTADLTQVTPIPSDGKEPTPTEEPTPTPAEIVATTPVPTIEPTGPRDNLIGIGIAGLILAIIGGVLFFIL